MEPCSLALETGDVFHGNSIGSPGESFGELIFNTSMSGYQEILTDPSYKRQIIAMTYPEIGNYGIHPLESESSKIHASGFVVKNCYSFEVEKNRYPNKMPLKNFLIQNEIVAMSGVDTRKITKIIRQLGCVKSVISTTDHDDASLIAKAKNSPSISEFDCVGEVTTPTIYQFEPSDEWSIPLTSELVDHIVVVDYGVKKSILNYLRSGAKKVTVVPAYTTSQAIEELQPPPSGVLLSNGPGDPATFPDKGLTTVKNLIGKIPIFGICFGHQILLKAQGHQTFKLKFGHHAANHPVQSRSGKVAITSQNHGYAVKEQPMVEQVNLNDHTIAGYLNHRQHCFSVQYHPEAAPGPHDSLYLFKDFFQMIHQFKQTSEKAKR